MPSYIITSSVLPEILSQESSALLLHFPNDNNSQILLLQALKLKS
jgi:hypothetical protein